MEAVRCGEGKFGVEQVAFGNLYNLELAEPCKAESYVADILAP